MKSGEVKALMERIVEEYPDRDHGPARSYDVHDRRASRAAIVRKLRRRSR